MTEMLSGNPVQIMLVEDSPEYREVIRLALLDRTDMEMTSCFGTSEIAIRTLKEKNCDVVPDLILLDLRLPGRSGLESLAEILECSRGAKIIVLTQSDDPQDVLRAISLGASGYLLKSATLDEIIDGILAVHGGGATLDSGVAKFIIDTLHRKLAKPDQQNLLTERELDIIKLQAEGLVKKEIASRLNIGYSTVDTHVAHIYEKLGVSNAPAAIHRAHSLGLLPPEG
ncbi:response regulator [Neorhodopirellula lusitana]|uniref:response regulator n=1 Tax=Neorhodopirellula lusitana TaxID=445327 RepID=UPI00384FED79